MIRLTITAKDGFIGWLDFENQIDVDSYIDEIATTSKWGKPQRWEALSDGDPQIQNALDSRQIQIQEVRDENDNIIQEAYSYMEYELPAEYELNQQDVTQEYNLEQATNQALFNQQIGAKVIATVAAINEMKLSDGSMTQQQFNSLLADQTISNIERLLWNGSLVTAKALIQSLDQTYYTIDEKNKILALLP